MRVNASPQPPVSPLSRRVLLAVVCVALGAPLVARVLTGGQPTRLVAAEVDTLEGGVRLGERLIAPHDGKPLGARLRDGFRPPDDHPHVAAIPSDQEARRLVVTAPVPRWVAFAGITAWPVGDDALNATRASWAATVLAMFTCLLWALAFGPLNAAITFAFVLCVPEGREAIVGYGYGISGLLAATLVVIGSDRLASGTSRRDRFVAATGTTFGLAVALGTHPFSFFALFVPFFVRALVPRTIADAPETTQKGHVTPPPLPLTLIVWPVLAVVVLIAAWPTLWNGTGKRLIAYLLENGVTAAPAQTVGAMVFDQAANRAPQAFTPLLQLVAWVPWPLLALAVVGLFRSVRARAAVLPWCVAILLAGCLDGGLVGGRMTLFPFLIGPIAWLGVEGLRSLPLPTRVGLSWRTPLAALAVATMVIVLDLAGAHDGLRRRTGLEAAHAVPLAVLEPVRAASSLTPVSASLAVVGEAAPFRPAFQVLADHFGSGISLVAESEAAWFFEQGARRFEPDPSVVSEDAVGVYTRVRQRPAPETPAHGPTGD